MEKRRIEPENPRSYTVCRAQQKGLSVADDVMVVEDLPSLCCTDEEADTRLVWHVNICVKIRRDRSSLDPQIQMSLLFCFDVK